MSWKQVASRKQSAICDNYCSKSLTLCYPMDCSTSGFPILHWFLESTQLMSIESVMPSNLSSSVTPSLPALSLSQHQGLFQWVGSSHQAEYWSFSFSISPSSEYSGSVAFQIKSFSLPQHFVSQIHSLACPVESRANSYSVTRGHLLDAWNSAPPYFGCKTTERYQKTMEVNQWEIPKPAAPEWLFTVELPPELGCVCVCHSVVSNSLQILCFKMLRS